ncbi:MULTISPECIES: hypothetical protein [Clostridium]|uniref:hypothetical protein n=1 Tax=Clostridium TaxID=1485 RepID=UPI000824770B|nr:MULTISPECIES: hypothetical protein [Clostridium]PJI07825.1 hypothetical protein CUB90_08100 [Clostridium sp. CT7]
MGVLYIEGLSDEYKKKIKKRELSLKSIDSIFHSIKDTYHQRKKGMLCASIMLTAIFLIMDVMTALNELKTNQLNMSTLVFPIVIIPFILALCYFLCVSRIPRQFNKCLKIGYPELMDQYGYDAIKAPKIKNNNRK